MQSLECMTSYVRRATGDVPPPLVGPSTTFASPNHVYLFGGRTVSTRRVTASLYVLDLRTLVWTQIKSPVRQPSTATTADDGPARHVTGTHTSAPLPSHENDNATGAENPAIGHPPIWPTPRYFHTADMWQDKLIIFGGMGSAPVHTTSRPSTSPPSVGATAAATPRPPTAAPEQPCVLADLWILDLGTLEWSHHPADPSSPASSPAFPSGSATRPTTPPTSAVPVARYAHLSAVVADRLVVMGGQELSNAYVHQRATFHLPSLRWESAHTLPPEEIRGSYRSVVVSCSQWEEVRPSSSVHGQGRARQAGGTDAPAVVGTRLTFSRPRRSTLNEPSSSSSPSPPPPPPSEEQDHDQEHVLAPHGDIYLFSNSNFTDVQRELYSITVVDPETTTTADLTSYLAPRAPHTASAAAASAQPPGLRFPFATQIAHHLVLGGTYLSQSTAQFAVWALNLVTWEWSKIDAEVLEGSGERVAPRQRRAGVGEALLAEASGLSESGLSGGSWNRAVHWPRDLRRATKDGENERDDGGKLLVFGNRYRNLQDDYEHRAINFDHVAVIELEVFGIYQPPLPHPRLYAQQQGGRWGPNDGRSRAEHALGFLHEEYLADFNVVCEDGRVIRCSSRLLEVRWTWFREARQRHRGDRPRSRTLYISESFPIVQAFLEYLYTLDLVTPLQYRAPVLSGLLMLAKQYQMNHLERLAVHAMHTRLDESTALGIYEVATLCECRELQVRALKLVLAMQKRAGKGTHHRRQQSAGPAAAMTAGGATGGGGTLPPTAGAAPASEGDSARTMNGSTGGESTTGHHRVNSKGGGGSGGHGLVEGEGGASVGPTAPPSAFPTSPGKRRRTTSTRSRSCSSTSGSETALDAQAAARDGRAQCMNVVNGEVADSSAADLAAEVDDYSPPTYRTRRRSVSVASLHHFTSTRGGESIRGVSTQGQQFVPGHADEPLPPSPADDGHRRGSKHGTRKMASMSSLFSFPHSRRTTDAPPSRPASAARALAKLQIGASSSSSWLDPQAAPPLRRHREAGAGGGVYTSDSSMSPSSPLTPTPNQPICVFPGGRETAQAQGSVHSPPRPPPSSMLVNRKAAPVTMHFLPVTG